MCMIGLEHTIFQGGSNSLSSLILRPLRIFCHNYHLKIFCNLLIMMSFKGFDGS